MRPAVPGAGDGEGQGDFLGRTRTEGLVHPEAVCVRALENHLGSTVCLGPHGTPRSDHRHFPLFCAEAVRVLDGVRDHSLSRSKEIVLLRCHIGFRADTHETRDASSESCCQDGDKREALSHGEARNRVAGPVHDGGLIGRTKGDLLSSRGKAPCSWGKMRDAEGGSRSNQDQSRRGGPRSNGAEAPALVPRRASVGTEKCLDLEFLPEETKCVWTEAVAADASDPSIHLLEAMDLVQSLHALERPEA
jgi:hypothetical protein